MTLRLTRPRPQMPPTPDLLQGFCIVNKEILQKENILFGATESDVWSSVGAGAKGVHTGLVRAQTN